MNDTYLYGEMFSENILTSYRIYGDRKSLLTPLIILHGGPSGGFDYLLNYRRLADDGRMVIFYDQYGCGRSTHFPHADASFWTIARYLRQLTQLINHLGIGHGYSILGHSWGGMLAAEHACLQPAGLRGAILASSPASIALWQQEGIRLFNALTPMSDDDIKNVIMPPSFIKTHRNSWSLTMPGTFIPLRKKPFMFSALMRSSPPTLRVITFYGEPMNWRQMANLPTGILRPICARYAVLFWYYAAKTIRQPSASSLRCSLTFQTAARSLFPAAAITHMKKISRPASQR